MATYLGKSIVDATPQAYNERWKSNQKWRCSKNVDCSAGAFALKISNWRHQGDTTPVPVFDMRIDIRFAFNIGISIGYKEADGSWKFRPSVGGIVLGRDKTFATDIANGTDQDGVWFQSTKPVKLYLGNIRNFTAPFFFHMFAGTPGEQLPLSAEFSW